MLIGTLHRPMIFALVKRDTASVTIPAGLVKLMIRRPAPIFHPASDIQHHRYGAQRFGEAADAGGFTAEQLVFQAQPFIRGARRQLPNAELGQHESGAANGVVQREVH